MKFSYALVTDFHGRTSVARFASASDRNKFRREYGVPVIDPKMGACWDTGHKSAEAISASDARVRAAIREDRWSDEGFDVRTYEGEVTGEIEYECAI